MTTFWHVAGVILSARAPVTPALSGSSAVAIFYWGAESSGPCWQSRLWGPNVAPLKWRDGSCVTWHCLLASYGAGRIAGAVAALSKAREEVKKTQRELHDSPVLVARLKAINWSMIFCPYLKEAESQNSCSQVLRGFYASSYRFCARRACKQ